MLLPLVAWAAMTQVPVPTAICTCPHGYFPTAISFSSDARSTSTSSREFIRLIDGSDFIDMWQEYYDKMSDDDKNLLPLKRISFLGNNE